MVIEFKSVTVSKASRFRQRNSAASFSACTTSIFDRHDPFRKVALIHVEIKTVHGDQLRECDVVRLLLRVSQVVTEHEATSFTGVSMKVYIHFQAVVLVCLLDYCFSCRPNCRLFYFAWIQVPSV